MDRFLNVRKDLVLDPPSFKDVDENKFKMNNEDLKDLE